MSNTEQTRAPQDFGFDPIARESDNGDLQGLMTLLGAKRLRVGLINAISPVADSVPFLVARPNRLLNAAINILVAGAGSNTVLTLPDADCLVLGAFAAIGQVTVANTIFARMTVLSPTPTGGLASSTPFVFPESTFRQQFGVTTAIFNERCTWDWYPGRFMRAGSSFTLALANTGAAAQLANNSFQVIYVPLAERVA
jgi:hypothetical protein